MERVRVIRAVETGLVADSRGEVYTREKQRCYLRRPREERRHWSASASPNAPLSYDSAGDGAALWSEPGVEAWSAATALADMVGSGCRWNEWLGSLLSDEDPRLSDRTIGGRRFSPSHAELGAERNNLPAAIAKPSKSWGRRETWQSPLQDATLEKVSVPNSMGY
jgi:hypothetical protein